MGRDDKELTLDEIATWPDTAQDESLTSLQEAETKYSGVYQLSDEERAAVRGGASPRRVQANSRVTRKFPRFLTAFADEGQVVIDRPDLTRRDIHLYCRA